MLERKPAILLGLSLCALGCGDVRTQAENRPQAAPQASGERSRELEFDGAPELGGRPPMPSSVTISEVPGVRVEAVARNLEVPWALDFAPDGTLFFTERPGRIRKLRPGGAPETLLDLQGVVHRGEGGLMGLALHPRFPEEPYLYVMYTADREGRVVNRISRLTQRGTTAGEERVLLDDIPAAQFHDGGALEFGPDGMLYAGTGDARKPTFAQDRSSLAGKILRLRPEGGVPEDNPFSGSPVWAFGFRNVTGLAWHPETGELWAASHGPSGEFGGLRNRDAVYVVRKGGNHGWPVVVGATERAGVESPVLYYPDEAVPPGGTLFYTGSLLPQFRGSLFLTSLGTTHLQHIEVEGERKIAHIGRWWPGKYGRLRAIEQGPDGALYFSTSNRDGRAESPHPGSDFIYRITPTR